MSQRSELQDRGTALSSGDLPAGVLLYLEGPSQILRAANQAARDALGGGALDGRAVAELIHSRLGEAAEHAVRDALADGCEHAFWVPVAPGGIGRRRARGFTVVPDLTAEGQVTGVLLSSLDDAVEGATAPVAASVPGSLQRHMRPSALPILPHVHLESFYDCPSPRRWGGADWFDMITLPDGSTGLLVGDVVGQDAESTVAMGQLRAVAGHVLSIGLDPEDTLRQLDAYASRVPKLRGSTVAVAVLDPSSRSLRVSQRGHLPPLVVSRDGAHKFVSLPPSAPLGLKGACATASLQLDDGDVVVLYSDGLVTRTGLQLESGLDTLAAVASAIGVEEGDGRTGTNPAERLARRTYGGLGALEDEATVLTARFSAEPPAALDFTLPARADSVPTLRHHLRTWLEGLGADEDDIFALEHAVVETVNNVIGHVRASGAPSDICFTANLHRDGFAAITVSDPGDWLDESDNLAASPRPTSDRSLGLVLMLELVEEMRVERSLGGTEVTLRKRLGHAPSFARTAARVQPGSTPDAAVDTYLHREGGRKVLVVRGQVTIDTVEDLRLALIAASRGGTEPVSVDVSGLGILASSGVSLLHSFVSDGSIRVRAMAGSPAHAVMTLTALPFTETQPPD